MHTAVIRLAVLVLGFHAVHTGKTPFIEPVPLQDVRLKPDSRFDKAVSLNREYLLGINSDRLLKTFRLNAGLDAPGEPFTGSWEDPSCEVRGQYLGHWLSGTAVLGNYSGDEAVISKAAHIVEELSKVQEALGQGYLSAFPREHLERLRRLESVWAPLYVIHKIMAGLLDQYVLLGDELALRVVRDQANWLRSYVTDVLWWQGEAHWRQMLETEYGGMEEVLYNLADVTGDIYLAELARLFTKPNFFEPLVDEVDTLPGRHANTHLAQVAGFAAGYELYGDEARGAATSNFFEVITLLHSYSTGGSNANEYWGPPRELGPTVAPDGTGRDTEETCTTYNMMKISRYLFRWSGDAKFADYYERAILNGMIGTQRMPADYKPSTTNALEEEVGSSSEPGVVEIEQQSLDSTGRRLLLESPTEVLTVRSELQASSGWTDADIPQREASSSVHPVTQLAAPKNSSLDWRSLAFQQFPGNTNFAEGNQPGPGVIIYLLPLGAANTKDDSWHHWSTPLNSFWCCSGSTSEQFGKLMDSIFFQRHTEGSAPELFINQLTPATLKWRLGKLHVSLEASLEDSDGIAKATLSLEPSKSSEEDDLDKERHHKAVLKLRIPSWLDVEKGGSVVLNDGEVEAFDLEPGSYLAIRRAFKSGDKIEMRLPMKVTTEPINDWRPEFSKFQAIVIGPFVMAALTDGQHSIQADPKNIAKLVQNVSTDGLVSFKQPDGTFLKQSGVSGISSVAREDCLPLMECTFRLLERRTLGSKVDMSPVSKTTSLEADIVVESMHRPGQFLSIDESGVMRMAFGGMDTAHSWQFKPSSGNTPPGLTLATHDSVQGNRAELHVDSPLGDYPAGSRLLVGEDRSYVIAPLGNLVEERYSPYLSFEGGSSSSSSSTLLS